MGGAVALVTSTRLVGTTHAPFLTAGARVLTVTTLFRFYAATARVSYLGCLNRCVHSVDFGGLLSMGGDVPLQCIPVLCKSFRVTAKYCLGFVLTFLGIP